MLPFEPSPNKVRPAAPVMVADATVLIAKPLTAVEWPFNVMTPYEVLVALITAAALLA